MRKEQYGSYIYQLLQLHIRGSYRQEKKSGQLFSLKLVSVYYVVLDRFGNFFANT
jgi:hypothetical protein